MLCPMKWQFDSAKVYTVGAGIKWNESRKGCIGRVNIYGLNNRNFYYESPHKKESPNWLSILSATNGSSYGGICFWSGWTSSAGPKDIIGNTIHVEITNPFMYEGAFLNPPKEKSLDTLENSYLLCSDISNPVIYQLRSLTFGKGWLRVCHVSTKKPISTESLTSINLIKTGGNARTARLGIKFFFFVANSSETYGYIEVDSWQASNLVRFTAARFAKSPEGDVFLEVFNNISTSNLDRVYVTRVDCSCGYDSSNLLRIGESSLSMYKVNDATGDNDTLIGNQVDIGANTNLFSIAF